MNFSHRQTVPLWTGTAPLARGNDSPDIPTITPFFPQVWKKLPQSVIVFPGGGYCKLAIHEGEGYADYLAANGITAFVVNYRLGADGYRHPAMISDACRAVRLVRAHAAALGIDPHRIGVMGSSAGGHLAATCSTVPELALVEAGESDDPEAGRPDFSILCYPVMSGTAEWGHRGSFNQLLGENPEAELLRKLSPEQNVTDCTPPAFLWHTFEDGSVPVENSMAYAAELRKRQIPFELHVYEKGHHGIGMGEGREAYVLGARGDHPWCEECIRWIKTR